ncbi:S8 family peptidase [Staphylococcus massiliensis]|uniref:S8 family peptidase n=1 Tax=Staphylococcus massiliensis TaxID=555791 RepID=UPI001EDFB333|nr:S8 family peptidase [Staphylococcus massiliensis]MCG3402336.1 S8 family peptidase [Staphylococcus massiliensis]MCG3411697.1 S8 family peptidase [Staphylococcus massiliensis]
MKKVLFATVAMFVTLLLVSTNAFAKSNDNSKNDKKASDETYIVKFDGPAGNGLLKANGLSKEDIKHKFDYDNVYQLKLSDKKAKQLKKHPHVEFVEKNKTAKVDPMKGKSSGSGMSAQRIPYGLQNIHAPQVHNQGVTGKGVDVAVVDSGVDASHEDLNVVNSFSAFNGGANGDPSYDGVGHGTHVAGTIAAKDNGYGVVGVAPDANIHSAKVLDSQGYGDYVTIGRGIEWAVQNNVDVINLSLYVGQDSQFIRDVTRYANNNGIAVIAASGNYGNPQGTGDNIKLPGRYEQVMSVAASDRNNYRAPFSCTGPANEITAPGVDTLSTTPNNTYGAMSGTSMASPHIAGVAALIEQKYPNETTYQHRARMNKTAEPLGNPWWYGNGLVQADRAVS